MTFSNFDSKRHVATATLYVLLLNSVYAQTNSTTSCSPSSCSTICNPTCSSNQTCILTTMTQCGICPKAICLNKSEVSSSGSQTASSSSSNDTGAIVGGIIGGLAGLSIIVGIIAYCYLKKSKRLKGKLPFAFTNSANMPRGIHQEKTTNHPAAFATLAHQNDPPSMTFNRHSMLSLRDLNTINETEEGEEFEQRIAVQNKRISELLQSNPRLSIPTSVGSPSKRSTYYTTDEESDMDDRRSISTIESAAYVRTATPQSSVAVVQVVRAKAQIMRVNSVRSQAGGLARNNSVRTVLTAVSPSEISVNNHLNVSSTTVKEEDVDDEELPEFPTTPNHSSFAIVEDPFCDTQSTPSKNATAEYYNNTTS